MSADIKEGQRWWIPDGKFLTYELIYVHIGPLQEQQALLTSLQEVSLQSLLEIIMVEKK